MPSIHACLIIQALKQLGQQLFLHRLCPGLPWLTNWQVVGAMGLQLLALEQAGVCMLLASWVYDTLYHKFKMLTPLAVCQRTYLDPSPGEPYELPHARHAHSPR